MDESNLSDDEIQQLIAQLGSVSATQEKNQALEHQMKMVQMLREGPNMPQGQMAGRVYVAPNALQDIAAVANNNRAVNSSQSAIQGMQANAVQQEQARTAYMRLLAQALRGQQQGNPSQSYNPQAETNPSGIDISKLSGAMA